MGRGAMACWLAGLLVLAGGCDGGGPPAPTPVPVRASWPPEGAPAVSEGWPRLLGPHRDGVSPESDILTRWPDAGPPVLWEIPIGDGFSSPVVVGDALIVMEREGDVEHVRRLNAATGEEVWRKSYTTTYTDRFGHYSNGPYSTPLIEGEHVYTLGAQGQLHCWLLADGDLVWRRLLQDEYQVPEGLFPVAASPFIEGDSLIYNLGATDDEAGVIALNKTTGETLWNATDEPASCATPIAATIHGQRHLIVFGNLNLMSLDPQDGTVLWRRRHYCKSPDSTNATSPIVIDDLVLGVCGPGPGALCMQVLEDGTAEELWTDRRVLDSQFNSLIVIDGFVYGFSTKRQGGALLKCVEIATGELRWELPSDLGRGQGLAANGCLILIGEDGHLASVEVNPNEPILKCITPEPILEKPCYSSPALHKGLLYLRNEKRLVCYDLRGQSQPAGDAPH